MSVGKEVATEIFTGVLGRSISCLKLPEKCTGDECTVRVTLKHNRRVLKHESIPTIQVLSIVQRKK
jgi:hypothetical protein